MKCVEFGIENEKCIMLLHGGGLSWWNYKDAAEALSREYHVVLPLLDGHSGCDMPFSSVEDNAEHILEYVDANLGGKVFFLGGLSLGGQIALEMLYQRNDLCSYALIESAQLIPDAITAKLIGPSIEMCFGLIEKRWFSKLQFSYLGMKKELFEEYYRDSAAISCADMKRFIKASMLYSLKPEAESISTKLCVLAGEKEQRSVIKSAKLLNKTVPGSMLRIVPGLKHGQFSINRGKKYAEFIMDFINPEGKLNESQ